MTMRKLLMIPALFVAGVMGMMAQATLSIGDFEIKPGESKDVSVSMTNSVEITTIQFSLRLPDGLSIEEIYSEDDEEYLKFLLDEERMHKTHSLDYGVDVERENIDKVLIFSMKNKPFSGSEGAIAHFRVKASEEMEAGTYAMELLGMELVTPEAEACNPADFAATVTVVCPHTPGADGVCTLCGEALELVIDDTGESCGDFAPEYSTYAKAAYKREFDTGYAYSTVMLPFAPDEESRKNFRFYRLDQVSDDAVTFVEEEMPAANTPYLCCLRENATATDVITGGVTEVSATPVTVAYGTWQFVGSFTNGTIDCTDVTTGNYVFNPVQNTLHKVTKTLTVCPYSAYIRNVLSSVSSNANLRVCISYPTGIVEISKEEIEGFGTGMYDLQGRLLSKPVKGRIYIEDGKKKVY